MTKEKNQRGIVAGNIAIIILVIAIMGVSFSVWAKPYTTAISTTKTIVQSINDIAQTLVITNEAKEAFSDSKQVDTLAINAAFLKTMRENGELLSSDEFASRITNYYNTLVAVLTALFVLFTIVTYITIKSKFESKFEDKAREIESNQRQRIIDELRSMLNDSKKIDEVITSAVGGHIEDQIATKEEVCGLTSDMETYGQQIGSLSMTLGDVKNNQQELFKVVADLQEQVSAGATVYTNNADDNETGVEEVAETDEKTIDKDVSVAQEEKLANIRSDSASDKNTV